MVISLLYHAIRAQGSSMVNPFNVESMDQLIDEYDLQVIGKAHGYTRNGEPDADLEKEALEAAVGADVVLYCFGLDEVSESEGKDREHMQSASEPAPVVK